LQLGVGVLNLQSWFGSIRQQHTWVDFMPFSALMYMDAILLLKALFHDAFTLKVIASVRLDWK